MMKQKAVTRSLIFGAAVCAFIALDATGAMAANRVKGEYGTSKSHLSRVGAINQKLSRLCRKGQFKQRKVLRLSIGFKGKKGQGITGIAKPGWNLYDPTGAGDPKYTYHFFNQGYSNCRVYQALTPRTPQR